MPRIGLKAFLAQFDGRALAEGHEFIVVGPFCWGRAKTVAEAHRNAKSNSPGPSYLGRAGWRFVLYDAPPDTEISDIDGGLSYLSDGPKPVVLGRFNMPEPKGEEQL